MLRMTAGMPRMAGGPAQHPEFLFPILTTCPLVANTALIILFNQLESYSYFSLATFFFILNKAKKTI